MTEFILPSPVVSSQHLVGTAVYDPAGERLGSIDHVVIDERSGRVRYAVLEFGDLVDVGIGDDRYPLPWEVLRYDAARDAYVITLGKAMLARGPRYRAKDRPHDSSGWGWDVYGHYGSVS